MKKKFYLVIGTVVGSIVAFIACSTVPVTGRSQLNLVSPGEEARLGLTEFEKMKQAEPISKDPAANALVQKVGKRIAAVADLPDAQWEFVVFESKDANAFCLPGGKVGVYTGLLPIAKDEAGLATVIGHEVAHAVARHGAERMSQVTLAQAVGQGVSAASANAKPLTQQLIAAAYGAGAQYGVLLPFSRKQESEADHIGLIYMAKAGYNPSAAVDFWTRFADYGAKSGGSSTPSFLRTHPLDSVRIQQIKDWLPEARKYYKGDVVNPAK